MSRWSTGRLAQANAIGEWTGSEDLRTPTEFTADKVRKLPCHHTSLFRFAIYLILSPFFPPFHLDSSIPPLLFTSAFRRASESSRTHLTKSGCVNNASNAILRVVLTTSNSNRFHVASPISCTHCRTPATYFPAFATLRN